ncbi:MAG: RtcB family protein [Microscillaceae bacterium]|nr:RtcB family protein [Microscillaceae bacterium]MDW8461596.1 RtcB family protein [Cytophagales bacterium]
MKRSAKFQKKDFLRLGIYHKDLITEAVKIVNKWISQKHTTKSELEPILRDIVQKPENYLQDENFGSLARNIIRLQPAVLPTNLGMQNAKALELKKEVPHYTIFGKEQIEAGALEQMNTAMLLPISIAGALMPDAHQGYGLPIGGVLATQADKIIPFAVGVDIACRMCMSIFEIEANYLTKHENQLKNHLLKNTLFGAGAAFNKPMPDDLFDKPEWNSTSIIRQLKSKAIQQIGTSGTGNHFVEWGILEILQQDDLLKLPQGKYLALLSHSGSRGFGASIANYYSKLAMEKTKLPQQAKHLAWLDLNTQEGQEYWIAMNLAGEYASANHHQIHKKIAKSLGMFPVQMIENHHNFAWKETLANGMQVMVHRKGATPAKLNELGIIPGSMTAPGFVVKGLGNPKSLSSASHGAGRQMSRNEAKRTITPNDIRKILQEKGVTLIGGDLDEAPMAYKDIYQVMNAQSELVQVVAKFTPKIVRMAEPERRKSKQSNAQNSWLSEGE